MRPWAWIRFRVKRMTCYILGCENDYYGCPRCGHGLYDYEYVQVALIEPVRNLVRRIKYRFAKPPKCSQCGIACIRGRYGFWVCPNEDDGMHNDIPF